MPMDSNKCNTSEVFQGQIWSSCTAKSCSNNGGHAIPLQTSQVSLFWCETQAFGPNLTLSLQTRQISLFSVSSLTLLTLLVLLVQGYNCA